MTWHRKETVVCSVRPSFCAEISSVVLERATSVSEHTQSTLSQAFASGQSRALHWLGNVDSGTGWYAAQPIQGTAAASGPRCAASKCSNQTDRSQPHPTSTILTTTAKTFSDLAATSYGSDDQRRWPGDTHNRHQRAWTRRYSDGRLRPHRPRPATVLDTLAVFCKQAVACRSKVPLTPRTA